MGEDLGSVLGDGDGVLEVSRQAAVTSLDRPSVCQRLYRKGFLVDHRFNGDGHAVLYGQAVNCGIACHRADSADLEGALAACGLFAALGSLSGRGVKAKFCFDAFGAFCDVGCGISALLPIDCLSVSRISSPADRVSVGQQLLCAIKTRDVQGRIVLTLRELLGTWSENAACFAAGETVVGIVRSVEEYGVFIEIAPNLAGLAEPDASLKPGQSVSVYIKSILPDKMKIKLVVVNKNLGQALRFEPHYFVTRGRIKKWIYSTPQSRKQIETIF